MNGFDNDFNAMTLHKAREQELLKRAENERHIQSLREEESLRTRRKIRSYNRHNR